MTHRSKLGFLMALLLWGALLAGLIAVFSILNEGDAGQEPSWVLWATLLISGVLIFVLALLLRKRFNAPSVDLRGFISEVLRKGEERKKDEDLN
jgi:RsiW-degrading membrane proteinase PrsW (M82 family)